MGRVYNYYINIAITLDPYNPEPYDTHNAL